MSIKIVSLEIESFRGISLPRKIDFIKNGRSCSSLIVGDNGSGKSSIIDAIELVTRRMVPHKINIPNKFINKGVKIKMMLSDNSVSVYELEISEGGKPIFVSTKHFTKIPFIIRRKDISQFWNTQDGKKRKIFSGRTRISGDILIGLSESITKTFLDLTTLKNEISKIWLLTGEETEKLSFSITLENNNKVYPEQILSEANLDMLAFIIHIELIKKAVEAGQAPVLVLDDVFQSIDSGIRLKIVEHIIKNLRDWQIIITVHDRLWKEQLCELFKMNNIDLVVYEIKRWDSKNGPIIYFDSMNLYEALKENIDKWDINEIISNASILLEKICFELSWRLEIAVVKKKDDQYTLGDLWPGIYEELKKTNLNDISTEIDKMLNLREKSIEFARVILRLSDNTYCKDCGHWIRNIKYDNKCIGKSCRCGTLNLFEKKYLDGITKRIVK